MDALIRDVIITPLDIVGTTGGKVMHAMKKTSAGFSGFGEAYFSKIESGVVRAWKRHKEMTLNIAVPVGKIKFVLFDDRDRSNLRFQEVTISEENYCRLTIPPMLWVGFQGCGKSDSILLNIANIEHNSTEVERMDIDQINYNWSVD